MPFEGPFGNASLKFEGSINLATETDLNRLHEYELFLQARITDCERQSATDEQAELEDLLEETQVRIATIESAA